jgi:esterase
MDYASMADDLFGYFEKQGLTVREKSVSLVGHSMGGKTAIRFACSHPDLVSQLVILDAPPVDRLSFPSLNLPTQGLINAAYAVGDLSSLGYKEAKRSIESEVKDDLLKSALLFNLNERAGWDCNMQAIYDNQDNLFAFDHTGVYNGPVLVLNGADSYQRKIQSDLRYYRRAFPRLTSNHLVEVENAGHGLHFD